MQRVKNVGYDEDDLYSDEDDYVEEGGDEQGYTDEDRENFAALTPVVRAELEESGLQVDDGEIGQALWHYFWDVGKSVAYLKNSRTPRTASSEPPAKKEKPKSKFDEAAQKSAEKASKLKPFIDSARNTMPEENGLYETRGGHYPTHFQGLRLMMCLKHAWCQPKIGSRTHPGPDSTRISLANWCQHCPKHRGQNCWEVHRSWPN